MTDAIKPESGEVRPITMQDVRLAAGEGKLSAHDVLNAVNAILRNRVQPGRSPSREEWMNVSSELAAEFMNIDGPWCRGHLDMHEVWAALMGTQYAALFHPGDTPEGEAK